MPLNPSTLGAYKAIAKRFGTPNTVITGAADKPSLEAAFDRIHIEADAENRGRLPTVQFDLAVAIDSKPELEILLRDLRRAGHVLLGPLQAGAAFESERLEFVAPLVRSGRGLSVDADIDEYRPGGGCSAPFYVFRKIA